MSHRPGHHRQHSTLPGTGGVIVLLLMTGLAVAGDDGTAPGPLPPGPLHWQTTRVATAVLADGSVSTAVGVFHFTNATTTPVTLGPIRTSCGCVSTIADGTTYAPGAVGTITATFTIGCTLGEVHHHLLVATDATPDPEPLDFVVTITDPMAVCPRLLMWRRGADQDPQQIDVRFTQVGTVDRVEVLPSNGSLSEARVTDDPALWRLTFTAPQEQDPPSPLTIRAHTSTGVLERRIFVQRVR